MRAILKDGSDTTYTCYNIFNYVLTPSLIKLSEVYFLISVNVLTQEKCCCCIHLMTVSNCRRMYFKSGFWINNLLTLVFVLSLDLWVSTSRQFCSNQSFLCTKINSIVFFATIFLFVIIIDHQLLLQKRREILVLQFKNIFVFASKNKRTFHSICSYFLLYRLSRDVDCHILPLIEYTNRRFFNQQY